MELPNIPRRTDGTDGTPLKQGSHTFTVSPNGTTTVTPDRLDTLTGGMLDIADALRQAREEVHALRWALLVGVTICIGLYVKGAR